MYSVYNYAFSGKTGTHSGAKLLITFTSLLAIFLLLGSTSAHAASVTEGDFTIEQDRNKIVSVTDYSGTSSDVTLPATATINEVVYPVTTIKSSAFQGNEAITSVSIPEGYTDLPSSAFGGCTGLKSVNIPGSMTMLGANAFEGCTALESLTFDPDTADSLAIRNAVFINCTSLKSVQLPARLTDLNNGNIFYGCTALDTVTVASGNQNIFAENNLVYQRGEDGGAILSIYPFGLRESKVTLPATAGGLNVTTLAPFLFRNNACITEITVPSTVTTVERFAFNGCSALKTLNLLSETPITANSSCFKGMAQDSVISVPNEEVAASIAPRQETWGGTTEFYDSARTTVVVGSAAAAPAVVEASLSLQAAGLTEDGKVKFDLYLDSASCVSTMLVKLTYDPARMTLDTATGTGQVFGNVTHKEDVRGTVDLMFNQLDNVLGYTGDEQMKIATVTLIPETDITGRLTLTIAKTAVSGITGLDSPAASGTVTVNQDSASVLVADYDVNGDGTVDQVDITEAQRYYQETSKSDNWNNASKADVNSDGTVDLEDLVAIFRSLLNF